MASNVVTGDSVDLQISSRIKNLTSALFSPCTKAPASITGALSTIDALVNSCQKLEDGTRDLITAFANVVTFLPSGMHQIESESDALFNDFSADIGAFLEEKASALKLDGDSAVSPSEPAYVEPSCRWLRTNWFNPYPSAEVRADIARQTKCPRKDIDAWFIDARKRIGWNSLRRKHFGNKRSNIVQAAVAFVTDALPARAEPLSPSLELQFAEIQSRAEAMYDEKFAQSPLAKRLDSAVKEMTPALKQQLKQESVRQRQEERTIRGRKQPPPYPTPSNSPSSIPGALATPPSSPTESTSPQQNNAASKKRSRSPSESRGRSSPCRAPKRARTDSESAPVETNISSPAPSCNELATPSPDHPPINLVEVQSASPGNKRKRRLSDGFQFPAAKRPQVRPQVVSDPFPLVSPEDWEEWLHQHVPENFAITAAIPPPVSVEGPDSDTPLDIQIFNFPPVPELPALSVTNALIPDVVPSFSSNLVPPATNEAPLHNVAHWSTCSYTEPNVGYHPVLQFDLPISTDTQPTSSSMASMLTPFDPNSFVSDPQLFDLFAAPIASSSFHLPVVPSQTVQPSADSEAPLTEAEKEAKKRELEALEAKVQAIRAQIARS